MENCIVCDSSQKFLFPYRNFKYYRCQKCKLVSTRPLPSEADITAHYDQEFSDGSYKFGLEFSEQRAFVYRDMADRLEKYMARQELSFKESKTLDVGCFTGEFPFELQERGCHAFGVELQERAALIADQKLKHKVVRADLYGDVLPNTEFDVVSLIGVIEHVLNPKDFLKRCARVLKVGGVMMIQTPNSATVQARLMRQYWPPFEPVEHIHLFSPQSLRTLLIENGFENLEVQRHFKKLPISYVVNMFRHFGPELYKPAHFALNLLPQKMQNAYLPFYGGEMIMFAVKGKS